MTDHTDQRPADDHWWLSPGSEECPFCSGSWHAEALAYCIACDRPVCHVCVVDADAGDLLCPECAAQTRRQTEDSGAQEREEG